MFYFDNIDEKRILKSDLIKEMTCFFTTRETCIKSKDENLKNLVDENKKLICKYLEIEEKNLISPCQTHTANIEIAKENKFDYPDVDALILTSKNLGVFLNFADCTPIIIYDKKQNIGAVAHAGWRGTAKRIAPLTVQKMITECGSNVKDIYVVIGPAISICCYNVGDDVFEKLKSTVKNTEHLYQNRNGKFYVDLKGINQQQLKEIGVENIDVCPYCTVCNNENFFSYRKEHATTNRHSAVIKLN